jgi:hypothetical protein
LKSSQILSIIIAVFALVFVLLVPTAAWGYYYSTYLSKHPQKADTNSGGTGPAASTACGLTKDTLIPGVIMFERKNGKAVTTGKVASEYH